MRPNAINSEISGDINIYDISTPITFSNLDPGTHTLRVFATYPWDESYKNDIIEKGLENVKRFSWEKCAREVSSILQRRTSVT